MKSIKIPILILKILGWLNIIVGIIFLILTIISPITTHLKLRVFFSKSAPGFLEGLILLCLARGLSKEEKWSWYLGVGIFSLSLIFSIIGIIKGHPLYFLGIIVATILLSELIAEREIFTKQPKEKISQLFRKPGFIGTITGIIFLCLSAGISTYLIYTEAKEVKERIEKTIEENIMRATREKPYLRVISPNIRVIFPNGGERFARGTKVGIKWTGEGLENTIISIKLCGYDQDRNEVNYYDIISTVDKMPSTTKGLVDLASEEYGYEWHIPEDFNERFKPMPYYKILIWAHTPGRGIIGELGDRSDDFFIIY